MIREHVEAHPEFRDWETTNLVASDDMSNADGASTRPMSSAAGTPQPARSGTGVKLNLKRSNLDDED